MTWHFSIIDWHNNRLSISLVGFFKPQDKLPVGALFVCGYFTNWCLMPFFVGGRKVASKTKPKSSQRTCLSCLPVCLFCFSPEPSHEEVFASWRPADLVWILSCFSSKNVSEGIQSTSHWILNWGILRSKTFPTISFGEKAWKQWTGGLPLGFLCQKCFLCTKKENCLKIAQESKKWTKLPLEQFWPIRCRRGCKSEEFTCWLRQTICQTEIMSTMWQL